MRQIVSNTGPLISVEKLSQGYDFIRRLYDKLIVPPVVLEEVVAGQFATPDEYLQHYIISDLIEMRTVSQPQELFEAERLHEGETQAIQLALELEFRCSLRKQWDAGLRRVWGYKFPVLLAKLPSTRTPPRLRFFRIRYLRARVGGGEHGVRACYNLLAKRIFHGIMPRWQSRLSIVLRGIPVKRGRI